MAELKSSSKSKARIWNKIGERVRRDFLFQAAAGTMPGVAHHNVTGYNETLGNAPVVYDYFTYEQVLSIVSDNVNDVYNGTGAWLIRILGLDMNYEIQMEDVLLRGTTPVISQGFYIRVLEAAVLKAGTLSGATGTITIQGNNDSKLVGNIQIPSNRMLNGIFTVPAHTNGYLFEYSFSMGAPKECTVGIRSTTPVRENANWFMNRVDFMYGGQINRVSDIPLYFPEKTDIESISYINVDSTTYMVSNMDIILIDDTFEWEQLLQQDETYRLIKDGN